MNSKTSAEETNPLNLSLYINPPTLRKITIDDFEECAVKRLKLLRWIASQKSMKKPLLSNHFSHLHFQQQNTEIKIEYIDEKLKCNDIIKDTLSHFICRLAFSQISDYTKWFINQELSLFECKYLSSPSNVQQSIVQELCGDLFGNRRSFKKLKVSDIIQLDINGRSPIPMFEFADIQSKEYLNQYFPYHIIPFEHVLGLVSRRHVFLRRGFAFVPNHLLTNFICEKYRLLLCSQMERSKHALVQMKNNPEIMFQFSRVMYIIKGLHKTSNMDYNHITYKSNSYENRMSVVFHSQVSQLLLSFPLCMRYTYEHLLTDKHLKHGARLQLVLFLKGIGMPMNETIIFLKQKFRSWNSSYTYLVEHSYGQQGKKTNYSPFSCHAILNTKPSLNDFHGCPFKMFDRSVLIKYLNKYYAYDDRLHDHEISLMLETSHSNQYFLGACKHLFAVTHATQLDEQCVDMEDIQSSWSHPNQYFRASRRLLTKTNANDLKTKQMNLQKMKIKPKIGYDSFASTDMINAIRY